MAFAAPAAAPAPLGRPRRGDRRRGGLRPDGCDTATVDESISVLTLEPRTHDLLTPRAAARWPAEKPHPKLVVLDLVIDGTSLLDTVRTRLPAFPLRSPLWAGSPLVPFHARALLGEGPADLGDRDPPDHVALLMCPHCAVGGCGVLSARFGRAGSRVHWSDIGRQVSELGALGPFTFDAGQYDEVLRPLLSAPVHEPSP